MPTYEYQCLKCNHTFERFQGIRDEPVKRCPVCRCKVKRLIGRGAGIIFKGSGFYATDYRSPTYRRAQKRDAEGGGVDKKPGDSSSKSADKNKAETSTSTTK